ncbi:DUF882 domain-containing protein [Rhizobium sp. TRM95111]|nr:DUF882 domain-containing protein [Rhizobium alarense]MCF3638454.1 DUF882 domain-containing protein [Rhizobium alarense]
MRKLFKGAASRVPRIGLSLLLAAALATPSIVPSSTEAAGGTRSLKLFYIHTKEKAEITFKRNGRFDQKGLQQLNRFLRDWRRNEPTKMDPRLFDLVWEVYQKSGARGYIHVVSAYRSPATNSMLRSRSKGVAKKSQHMLGKAMDFYIPDVKLAALRSIAMKFQVGGVGYYPKSGAPFVHLDVGSVRAWPRMSRKELVSLFPDGKTLHLPSDGKPLPGYDQAVADYKRRVGADSVEVAGGGSPDTATRKRKGNFLAALFGQGGDEDEEPNAIASAEPIAEEKPVARSRETTKELPGVTTAEEPAAKTEQQTEVAFTAPVPLIRPAFKEQKQATTTELALVAPTTNGAAAALEAALPAEGENPSTETASLDDMKIPVPEMLGDRSQPGDAESEIMTASAGPMTDEEGFDAVPIPDARPAFESVLAAVAEAEVPVAQTEAVAAVADAEQSEGLSAAAATRVALADPTIDEEEARPVTLAALVPDTETRRAEDAFASAFDADGGAESGLKGGRPKKKDAEAVARGAIRSEPKLTQQIISKWALSQGRFATQSKPVKAPRFVSRTLRAAPTTVYSAGFDAGETTVDPGRFSGSAVNFMEVRKFAQVSN